MATASLVIAPIDSTVSAPHTLPSARIEPNRRPPQPTLLPLPHHIAPTDLHSPRYSRGFITSLPPSSTVRAVHSGMHRLHHPHRSAGLHLPHALDSCVFKSSVLRIFYFIDVIFLLLCFYSHVSQMNPKYPLNSTGSNVY